MIQYNQQIKLDLDAMLNEHFADNITVGSIEVFRAYIESNVKNAVDYATALTCLHRLRQYYLITQKKSKAKCFSIYKNELTFYFKKMVLIATHSPIKIIDLEDTKM